MMISLFAIFDPTSYILTNWLVGVFIMMFIPINKWVIKTKIFVPYNYLMDKILNEFKLLTHSFMPGMMLVFLSLFYFIILNNLIGLFPYIFTPTSHMSVTISISLIMWVSFNLFGWINNTNHMMSHLVPMGTPVALMNFMVLIESISSIIRPMTLSIRLSANMIAGHLLLTLLGGIGSNLNFMATGVLLFVQICLLVLEIAVAIIQSYVFSILAMLYISEVD